jgi:hypothetical protein
MVRQWTQPHPATVAAEQLLQQERGALHDADVKLAQRACYARSVYDELPEVQALKEPGLQNLERFERAWDWLFNHCGVRLGHLQMQFLATARLTLLRRMFGPRELDKALPYLRQRYHFKKLFDCAAIVFPRRSGKTTVQTLLAAVVLVSQPDGNVCCINLFGRQARTWLRQVVKWLELFKTSPEFAYTIVNQDMRESVQIHNCTSTLCRVSSYPGMRSDFSVLGHCKYTKRSVTR